MEARGEAFDTVFEVALEHGLCVGVSIPSRDAEVSRHALERLDPRERTWAEALPPPRRASWVAGRLALRRSVEAQGLALHPVLATAQGAPELPGGVAGSISHKSGLAVGLAAPHADGDLGIDLETDAPLDLRVARRVLTPAERQALQGRPEDIAARDLLLRFALKEAVYKALHPLLRRRVSFQEVEAEPLAGGDARIRLALGDAPVGLAAEARWRRRDGWILATARARVETGGQPV